MLTPQQKRRYLTIAMFVLPALMVKLSAWWLGSGPDHAAAHEWEYAEDDGYGDESGEDDARLPLPAEIAAAKYIQQIGDRGFKRAPLHGREWSDETAISEPPTDIKAPPTPRGVVAPPTDDNGPARPTFRVNAILFSNAGNIAILDGERYQSGDRVRQSPWRISRIDSRAVHLIHRQSGTHLTIELGLP